MPSTELISAGGGPPWKMARVAGRRVSAIIPAIARMRIPVSHRQDLRRMFFFTPIAEIHQYARNSTQPKPITDRSCIFGSPPSYRAQLILQTFIRKLAAQSSFQVDPLCNEGRTRRFTRVITAQRPYSSAPVASSRRSGDTAHVFGNPVDQSVWPVELGHGVAIVRFVMDHQPPIVACEFVDAGSSDGVHCCSESALVLSGLGQYTVTPFTVRVAAQDRCQPAIPGLRAPPKHATGERRRPGPLPNHP